MNLQEARPFVSHFISGDYASGGHEAFLDWLETASLEELDLIAREYEGLHEKWTLPEGPSEEWIRQLEEKLDKLDQQQAVIRRMRPRRRFMWIAAASMVALATGAYFWYSYGGPGNQNLVSVPKGEQKQLVLADGSKVWLNSASTLQYPKAFTGKERVVELTGEAYFEIVDNASMPFHVKTGAMQIEVLGTRFNVMAYDDEGVTRTSLVQGSIRVSNGAESQILKPGDEAEVNGEGMRITHGADAEYVLAWKNGYLSFDNSSLQTVMRAISRCYNVDIQYEGTITGKAFSGKFPRKADIHEALHILETQHVHYRIEGKTIIVRP